MNDTAVKLEKVSKFYKLYHSPKDRLKEALHPFGKKLHREFYALKNIDLEVKRGEILGIVGRNGSGKSTLLQLIARIIPANSGHLTVNGRISTLLDVGAGMDPNFTGIQNIFFGGLMQGFSHEEMKLRLDEIAAFADIGDFIHQPLKTYSWGMRARLGFALAVNVDPEILVVDEVLAVGDVMFQRKCYARMETMLTSGCTVLYVTHNANTANELCTRVILLDQGEVILDAPPRVTTAKFEQLLFSSPDRVAEVRREIGKLNHLSDTEKTSLAAAFAAPLPPEPAAEPTIGQGRLEEQPDLLPQMVSQSRVVYRTRDVDILDVHIRTLSGQRVNSLVPHQEYIYSYTVHFHEAFGNVQFGMKFRTVSGIEVTGMTVRPESMAGLRLERIEKGDRLEINWHFRNRLLPGEYFTNAGVSTRTGNGFEFLGRIVDALVFNVKTGQAEEVSGIVELVQRVELKRLRPPAGDAPASIP
jgi:lipopolysaccharide transport system ATP-binding protein